MYTIASRNKIVFNHMEVSIIKHLVQEKFSLCSVYTSYEVKNFAPLIQQLENLLAKISNSIKTFPDNVPRIL